MKPNSRNSSLRSDFIWTFGGNVVSAACQWLIIVMLAKLSSPEVVGQYMLGVAISSPIILFTTLQMRSVQATDFDNHYPFSFYLAFRMVAMAVAIVITAITCFVTGLKDETFVVVLAVCLGQAIEFVSDIYYGKMQKHERLDWIARSLIMRGPLALIAFAVVYSLTHSLIWGVVAMAMGRLTILIFFDARVTKFDEPAAPLTDPVKSAVQLLKLTLPLGIVGMLVSLNIQVPRYFIEHFMSNRELGIFAALASWLAAGQLVVSALGQSAFVRIAKAHRDGDTSLFNTVVLKVSMLSLGLGMTMVIGAKIAGARILHLLFRPEYAQYQDLFVLLLAVGGVSWIASCLGYALTAIRCIRPQIVLLFVVVGTTAAFSYLLISRYGMNGAAFAGLISSAVHVVGSLYILRSGRTDSEHAENSVY